MKAKLLAVIAAMGSACLAQDAPPVGYIERSEIDLTAVVEPAPLRGDPRYEADREIFRATRAFAGTERYELARQDTAIGPAQMLRNFSCSIGVSVTPKSAPHLAALGQRAATDVAAQVARAKEVYQRQRPYLIDDGPTCEAPRELLDAAENRASYDYPSGHSAWGWTWALVIAAVAPDRAQPVLERGRAYGDSRIVCGVHNFSAVESGRLAASATMAIIQTKPDYQADLAAARKELESLRTHSAPASEGCDIERRMLAQPILPSPASR